MPIKKLALMAGCLSVFCSAAAAQQSISSRYSFVTLDFPGAPVNYPLSINMKREIAGYYVDSTGVSHGYVYRNGNFTEIKFPGAFITIAGGINERGDVSGTYLDQQGFQHGYLRTMPDGCDEEREPNSWKCQPNFTSLDVPGAAETRIPFEFGPGLGTGAAGLNNRREVVGLYATQDLYSNGFIFSEGRYRSIDNPSADHTPGNGSKLFSINNFSVAAGAYQTQASPTSPVITHGFITEGGRYTPVYVPGSELGGFGTQANGINDFKVVAGIFSDQKGFGHALLWFQGLSFTVDYPGALFSEGHTINNRGDLTGAYVTDPRAGVVHGFVAYPKY
jgi:hypothetical protein